MQILPLQALFPDSPSWNRLILPCYCPGLQLILVLALGVFSPLFKNTCPVYPTHIKAQKEHLAASPAVSTAWHQPSLASLATVPAGSHQLHSVQREGGLLCTAPTLGIMMLTWVSPSISSQTANHWGYCSLSVAAPPTHLRVVVGLRCSVCHPNSVLHFVISSVISVLGVSCVEKCLLNS